MKYTNHLNSITVTDHAFDRFMETWTYKARAYNRLCKLGRQQEAERFYNDFWGMAEALHTLGIGYSVEYDDDLEYLTELEIWCGKLELSAKL